jgi:hypothetical protein
MRHFAFIFIALFSINAFAEYRITFSKTKAPIPEATECLKGGLPNDVVENLNTIKPNSYSGDSDYWCSLEDLRLSNYSGDFDFLKHLTALKHLDIQSTSFDTMPDFSMLKNIEFIDLSYNIIGTVDASKFSNLPKLKILRLNNNNNLDITGNFTNLPSLNEISLYATDYGNRPKNNLNCDNMDFCKLECKLSYDYPSSYVSLYDGSYLMTFFWDGYRLADINKSEAGLSSLSIALPIYKLEQDGYIYFAHDERKNLRSSGYNYQICRYRDI